MTKPTEAQLRELIIKYAEALKEPRPSARERAIAAFTRKPPGLITRTLNEIKRLVHRIIGVSQRVVHKFIFLTENKAPFRTTNCTEEHSAISRTRALGQLGTDAENYVGGSDWET